MVLRRDLKYSSIYYGGLWNELKMKERRKSFVIACKEDIMLQVTFKNFKHIELCTSSFHLCISKNLQLSCKSVL